MLAIICGTSDFRCKSILGAGGEIRPFGEAQLQEMNRSVIERKFFCHKFNTYSLFLAMASDGLRTIGLAYKDYVTGTPGPNEVCFELKTG